jgi:hypothetical protein
MASHNTVNSFILSVCLGVSGWVAYETSENGKRLAAVQASLESVRLAADKTERASTEAIQRLDRKLDDTLPRREFDARVLIIESEQRKADIRLREIDLEILKLRNNI